MPRKKSSGGTSPEDSAPTSPFNPLREIHAANAAAAAANAALIDSMNFADASKPFKNPSFKRGSARRNKATKAIIQAERARFDTQLTLYADNARAAKAIVDTEMQVDQQNPSLAISDLRTNYKALENGKKIPTFWNIEAPPPLIPPKHYCDLTGLPAPYTDPKTNLRFHSKEIYAIIKGLPHGAENAYLGLRNAAMVLK